MRPAAETLPAGPVVLHRWRASDAEAHYRAVVESLEHLAPWMGWATNGYTLADSRDYIARREEAWGVDFSYMMRTPGDVVAGCCSMMGRTGPGGLEIGYRVHPGHVRRGYATAAVAALVAEAFRIGVTRVEIVHDLANVASGSIPYRLGFTEIERRPPQEERTSAKIGPDVVWRLWAPGQPEK